MIFFMMHRLPVTSDVDSDVAELISLTGVTVLAASTVTARPNDSQPGNGLTGTCPHRQLLAIQSRFDQRRHHVHEQDRIQDSPQANWPSDG